MYNRARRHVFGAFEKNYHIGQAKYVLRQYQNRLPVTSLRGLEAGLLFYSRYRKPFKLGPGLDHGDKTDFHGYIEETPSRFDVTTNMAYKNKSNSKIEEYLHDGIAYWFVEVDLGEEEFKFIPLHFPTCSYCGSALYNLVYLVPEKWTGYISDYFSIIRVCPECGLYEEGPDFNWVVSMFRPLVEESFEYETRMAFEYDEIERIREEKRIQKGIEDLILQNGNSTAKLARVELNEPVAFVGEAEYFMTGRKGDGYWATKVYWRNIWAPTVNELEYYFLPHKSETFYR